MKKLALPLFFLATLFFGGSFVFAQEDYEFEEYDDFQEPASGYFAFGLGPMASVSKLDFDALNQKLANGNFGFNGAKFDGYLTQYGGGVFIAIGIIPNARAGVFWLDGSKKLTEKDDSLTLGGEAYYRNFAINSSFTAISFDYVILPFKSANFSIVPSISIGRGTFSLEYYQTKGESSWSDFTSSPNPNESYDKLETGYWIFEPSINFEYSPTLFAAIRLGIGYSIAANGDFFFKEDWSRGGNGKISGVPSDLNASGLSFNIGLFLGIFNY